MTIAIIEVMPKGHFTLVDSLVRIYASEPSNTVRLFTTKRGAEELEYLSNDVAGKLSIISKGELTISSFLKQIETRNLDKIYITTINKYFSDFFDFLNNRKVNLLIHDIDSWFASSLKFKFYTFFKEIKLSPIIIYKFKFSFIYPFFYKKIINKVKKSGGKFVILSSILKNELEKYVGSEKIEIVPFSVFKPNQSLRISGNKLLRVTIPGHISQLRRDYFSLLKMVEEDIGAFKNKIEFELLGCIETGGQGDEIFSISKKIIKLGVNIIYYENKYIPMPDYDNRLAETDLILGNMNVVLNKYSSYGKTKDTGIIFTMIRSAKPGIIINGYPVINELKTSAIYYSNYEQLKNILSNLANNPDKLNYLKKEAFQNSLKFEPSRLYKELNAEL